MASSGLAPGRHCSVAEIRLKGGYATRDPRLDRIPEFDPKSLNFPITLDPRFRQTIGGRTWVLDIRLDQGYDGACTGFSRAHDLASVPSVVKGMTNDYAKTIYRLAQQLDEWPGEDYEGSSVLGAVKAARQLGFIGEYRWAFGIDDVLASLSHVGPVVLGIPWLDSMFDPDLSGLLDCSGQVAGGHAILARSVHIPTLSNTVRISRTISGVRRSISIRSDVPLVGLVNSWSAGWGINGECWVRADDLERLLRNDGEACISTVAFA